VRYPEQYLLGRHKSNKIQTVKHNVL